MQAAKAAKRCESDSCGSEQGPVAGLCQRNNELPSSINGRGELSDWLKDYQLPKKDYAPRV
jgi:hypothetical protein